MYMRSQVAAVWLRNAVRSIPGKPPHFRQSIASPTSQFNVAYSPAPPSTSIIWPVIHADSSEAR